MSFVVEWGRSGPTLKRSQTCEACGQPFACEISLTGCWCSGVRLSDEVRARIRARYNTCLCRTCLEALQTAAGEPADAGR
jgi:hypothetical protein